MEVALKPKIKVKAKKAASATNKAGDLMTRNAKTVLYVGIGALAIFVGYKVVKSINAVGEVFVDDPSAGGGAIGDIKNPSKTPTGATINHIQAQTAAATILSAVDGLGGLNEKEYITVENVLKGRTPKDFQMISDAFGMPKRSPLTGEQSFWFFGEKLNLSQWLTIEMNEEQRSRIRVAAPLLF